MGYGRREKWLFWNYPLEPYFLALQKARRIFNKVRWVTAFIVGLNFWVWGAFFIYKGKLIPNNFENFDLVGFISSFSNTSKAFFWLGLVCFGYVFYRSIVEHKKRELVEHFDYKNTADNISAVQDWKEAGKISKRKRLAINNTFTEEALAVLGGAYSIADKRKDKNFHPFHLFLSLLSNNRIGNIFIRLGIPAQDAQKQIEPFLQEEKSNTAPVVSEDINQILFYSYEEAYRSRNEYVSVTELLVATVKQSEKIQEILYDLAVDKQKLLNVVEWARIRERLYRQYLEFKSAARHRSKYGMDKAMTAVATPYLNQFSEDLTLKAQFGRAAPCVAREKEIEQVFQIVDGGQGNVVLVGDFGVGKKSVVEGIAEKMIKDDVPDRLKDKRLVSLSVSSLLAGTTPTGAVERLINIMTEMGRAKNIILLIHNIHELFGVSAGEGQSLDVADTLAEQLSSGNFMTIATTTTEAFSQHISNSKLSNLFAKVEIREMDQNQAIQVLESKVGAIEFKQQVFFAYDAIAKAVELAKRFIHDVYLPGSALELISEAASFARNKKGVNSLVSAEEVAAVVAEKTKIPVNTITSDESTKLLRLEEEMHKRVIGQDEAVNLVANALRRARAEIRSGARPIANFLFLGPTGVGKTELAKTIAEVYFGGEERMIRLDMSEYQDKTGIYRLIGAPGEKGTGILTEAARRSPFALLLLDEIEKADKDILNLFLQVMDDGRLTDSTGHVVDFTNIILIATSNAGTSYVQEQMRGGLSGDVIKDRLLHGELKQYFRPEFLNRFDGIVLFQPLDHAAIKKIAGLMLKRVAKDLDVKGIELAIKDEALEYFAQVGFDPEFGARPLRRTLQEKVENQLAELLLSGKLKRRDKVEIGAEGMLSIKNI